MRTSTAADRDATRAVVDAVRVLLQSDDAALAQRITATLLAAVVDPALADRLRAGRLAAEQTSPGFGFDVDDAEIIPFQRPAPRGEEAAAVKAAADGVRAQRRAAAEHRKLVARLEASARRLAAKADEAEQTAAAARQAADAAAAELAVARDADDPAD